MRGDCDDADSSVHPGAEDLPGDGLDSDCGGTDSAEPHVGYATSCFASLQEALDAAEAGTTLWVGPGTYLEHELSFSGKALRLASSHLAARTVVDAEGQGSVFVFEAHEGSDTELDGFTLTGGSAPLGGGVRITASSPAIKRCVLTGNEARLEVSGTTEPDGNYWETVTSGYGGGVYMAKGAMKT